MTPCRPDAGLNVAIVECETGNRGEASGALRKVVKFAPEDGKAHDLPAAIETGKLTCTEGENHRR